MPPPQLGRRPADPERYRATIELPMTGVPVHPVVADHLSGVPTWVLGQNYVFGTCGPVSVANHAKMTWKYLLGEDITVTDDAVFDLYRRSGNPDFDPATGAGDNGVDMTVMLSALVKYGIEITHANGDVELVKPLCFAKTGQSIGTIRAVTAIFGGLLFGLDLQVAQQEQTEHGLWYFDLSPAWGGHATMAGRYTSDPDPNRADESLVTWGEVVGTTDVFLGSQLAETYVIVWKPLWDKPSFTDGVDRMVLAADYTAVTGRVFPWPATPTPAPAPPDPDAALWDALKPWALARHVSGNRAAANTVRAWAKAKGFS